MKTHVVYIQKLQNAESLQNAGLVCFTCTTCQYRLFLLMVSIKGSVLRYGKSFLVKLKAIVVENTNQKYIGTLQALIVC